MGHLQLAECLTGEGDAPVLAEGSTASLARGSGKCLRKTLKMLMNEDRNQYPGLEVP
jgi:hypothetical protein